VAARATSADSRAEKSIQSFNNLRFQKNDEIEMGFDGVGCAVCGGESLVTFDVHNLCLLFPAVETGDIMCLMLE
jgi:hypothetical protein